MAFDGVRMIDIDCLKPSQIYLSQKKIEDVLSWFDPSLDSFQPISARDFLGDGHLHITDGHTRTFIAWQHGIKQIPYIYDENEIVTCMLGQIQYVNDIEWCNRFDLQHISALADRILLEDDYEILWRGRCGVMYDLEVGLLEGKIDKKSLEEEKNALARQGLFVYGISEDYSTLYYGNISGELFKKRRDQHVV